MAARTGGAFNPLEFDESFDIGQRVPTATAGRGGNAQCETRPKNVQAPPAPEPVCEPCRRENE